MLIEKANQLKCNPEFQRKHWGEVLGDVGLIHVSGISRLENGHHDPRLIETVIPVLRALQFWDPDIRFEDVWDY